MCCLEIHLLLFLVDGLLCYIFINDASGSLCEICDPDAPDDPVIHALTSDTLILYILPNSTYEEDLKSRARTNPKPLFYNPKFILPKLASQPDNGAGVEPVEFARPLFPELLEFRKPRYKSIANNFGFTILSEEIFQPLDGVGAPMDSNTFLDRVYAIVTEQAAETVTAMSNLENYLTACENRKKCRKRYL